MSRRVLVVLGLGLAACGGEADERGFLVVVPQQVQIQRVERVEVAVVEPRVVLRNVASGRCLDVPRQTADSRTLLWTWNCNHTFAQTWALKRTDDAYVLSSAASGKCLDVPYASNSSNITLWQFDCNDSRAQQWSLERTTSGSYLVRSRASGLCLDVPHGQASNGIGVQQYPCHGGEAQRWELTAAL